MHFKYEVRYVIIVIKCNLRLNVRENKSEKKDNIIIIIYITRIYVTLIIYIILITHKK